MDLAAVRKHWEDAGKGLDPTAAVTPTSRDPFLGELERRNVLAHLRPTDTALEIGCGVGTHSFAYARAVREFVGVDVAESLLEHARRGAEAEKVANATFARGDVLDLVRLCHNRGSTVASFDAVISQRCLINLPTWELQQAALDQIRQVLRPGGLLLLTEGFQGELDALNDVRARVGLDPIRVVPYNRNLERAPFLAAISDSWEVLEEHDYGAYLFLSRVLHPLAVAPDPPLHDGRINEAAMKLADAFDAPQCSRYGYNRFFVLRPR